MNRRQLLLFFAIAIVLTFAGVFLFDQPVAAFVQRAGGRQSPVLQEGTHWLEIASGFPIARYFLTFLLLGGAALLFFAKSTRRIAWMLLFVGSANLVTRLLAGVLKNVFNRLRPFEVIQAGNWDWHFFGENGSSFPSGHSAHFWSLFLPLMFLFPRFRLLFLVVPLFITVARVGVNDHWCSDVIASAGVAALITFLFAWLYRIKVSQPADGRVAARGENSSV